jgi:hypothetical protein
VNPESSIASGTQISNTGRLKVAEEEVTPVLIVHAALKSEPNIYDEVCVLVKNRHSSEIDISTKTTSVKAGSSMKFT